MKHGMRLHMSLYFRWSAVLVGYATILLPYGDTIAAVSRPAGNTGTGFFVSGGELYDANGFDFRIRGVNHTHAFGVQSQNTAAIPEIAKSGANAVRMVLYRNGAGITLTASQQRDRIRDYLSHQIVPIVELHDYTGGNSDTNGNAIVQAVDYWLEPERKAYLQEYEREVILNIANEWGPNTTVWRDAYIAGVQRLRDAGINNLIMIDAGGNFGQNPNSIKSWGAQVLNADPLKNIVFSQHMYGFWFTSQSVPGWAFSVRNQLTAIKNLGLPIVIGEFGWENHSDVSYDTSDAMQIYEELGIGWMAWAWYRGMNPGDTLSLIQNVNGTHAYAYNSDADLTPYGELVINHPDFGMKNAAEKASIFFPTGDFNRDGQVDAADYTVWRNGLGTKYMSNDYDLWKSNFGSSVGSGAGGGTELVPEPATGLVAAFGVAAYVLLGGRSRARQAFGSF